MKRLNYKKEFAAGVAAVWDALVSAEALSQWLMKTDFRPEVGAEFGFSEPGLKVSGKVLEVVQNEKLAYLWVSKRDDQEGEAGTPSVVTWNLRPTESGGTQLSMEHEMLELPEPVVLIEAAVNWQYAIHGSLVAFLGGSYRQPTPIVYMKDQPESEEMKNRRAGFRQQPLVNA